MTSTTYAEAVNVALDRLRTTGFYLDNFFANHGPMAAEAMARLGYCDEVDGWVGANIHHRKYDPLPVGWQKINLESPEHWHEALGDRKRGGDWVELFRRELAENPWREVLETWWPSYSGLRRIADPRTYPHGARRPQPGSGRRSD